MATANDIITGALRLLTVIASGEAVPADQAKDGLTALNQMIAGLKMDGIDLGLSTLTQAAVVAVLDEEVKALRYLLAVDLAPEFGMAPPLIVAQQAETGRITLQARHAVVEPMTLDPSLVCLPSQRRRW
ncbi:hypothetical protein [Azospirillum argentinense]